MTDEPAAEAPVTITIKAKGPYLVRGPVRIETQDGETIEPPPAKTPGVVKLCGCGHTETKPFCDGAHKACLPTEPSQTET
jgi:CDGSH-type Zn-finger protein